MRESWNCWEGPRSFARSFLPDSLGGGSAKNTYFRLNNINNRNRYPSTVCNRVVLQLILRMINKAIIIKRGLLLRMIKTRGLNILRNDSLKHFKKWLHSEHLKLIKLITKRKRWRRLNWFPRERDEEGLIDYQEMKKASALGKNYQEMKKA